MYLLVTGTTKMEDLNQLIVSQLFSLDNWISKGNTGIDKR